MPEVFDEEDDERSYPPPVINTRRPDLLERARRWRKPPRRQRTKGSQSLSGMVFSVLRPVVMVSGVVAGGIYLYPLFAEREIRPEPETPIVRASEASHLPTDIEAEEPAQRPAPPTHSPAPKNFEPLLASEKPTEHIPPRITLESEWYRADAVTEPTRKLLARLEIAEKDFARLKEYLQTVQNDGVFGQQEFRYGSRYKLVSQWLKLKTDSFPVTREELTKRRDEFNAALERAKVGNALEEDPKTIFKTYEFAGKALRLEMKDGLFVIPGTPSGPEVFVEDLKQLKDAVSPP